MCGCGTAAAVRVRMTEENLVSDHKKEKKNSCHSDCQKGFQVDHALKTKTAKTGATKTKTKTIDHIRGELHYVP